MSRLVAEPPASELLEIERKIRSVEQQFEPTKPQNVQVKVGTNGVYIT